MTYYVAFGLSGYGPDLEPEDEGFESLGEALLAARDELARAIDDCHSLAHACGAAGNYREAWLEVVRMEELETLRANLDPARAKAPLYHEDPAAYERLQRTQLDELFPVDTSEAGRLYVWEADES